MTSLSRQNSLDWLRNLLADRILVYDGSLSSLIYAKRPTEADYRGERFRNHPIQLLNCTDVLVLTQPRLIEDIHLAYLEAGADIIETCTLNATPMSLAEFGLGDVVPEINRTAVLLARRAADEFTRRNPAKPRFVAGCIGPTTRSLYMEPGRLDGSRTFTYDDFVADYTTQIETLVEAGVDLLSLDYGQDILVLKACLFAISKYEDEHRVRIPTILAAEIYENGRTLLGMTPEDYFTSVSSFDALCVGYGCGESIHLMRPMIERVAKIATRPIICHPCVGLPDGQGGFNGLSRDGMAQTLGEFARKGWIHVVGSCFGLTPDWVAAIEREVRDVRPRRFDIR